MVGGGHVHRHGFNLGLGPAQPPPERLQRVSSLAVADEDHSTAFEVQDDRHVPMALGDGDLINGDLAEVPQLGLGVASAQVTFLDVLDDVPTDAQVPGHVEDGHAPRQFQGIALEGFGVGSPWVGKGDLHLADHATGPADDAGEREDKDCGTTTDGQRPELALNSATGLNISRAARCTPESLALLINGEDHLATLILSADVLIAPDTKGVIQQAGGHADLLIWSLLTQLQIESACPPSFNLPRASAG